MHISNLLCMCLASPFRLRAELINAVKAVSYVLKAECVEGDAISILRSDIMAIVEAKQADGKKPPPKKGEELALTSLDPNAVEVTEALCASLPVRRCIAAMIQTHPLCKRKGYVIDAWDASILSVDDVGEMISGTRRAARSEEETSDEVPGHPAVPELLVELHCADATVIQRYLVSLGIADGGLAKSSKENQAAVKTLETALATYAATMKPTNSASLEGETAPAFAASHGVVLDIEQFASDLCSVARFDTRDDGQLESVSHQVCQRLCKLRGGTIGWLPELRLPAEATGADSIPVALPPDEQIIGEAGAVGMGEEGPTKRERSLFQINESVAHLSTDSRSALIGKCDELQEYLLNNVLPCLVKGMVAMGKDKPEDPIVFISQYLKIEGQRKEDAAREEAFQAFQRVLQEAREVEAQITV